MSVLQVKAVVPDAKINQDIVLQDAVRSRLKFDSVLHNAVHLLVVKAKSEILQIRITQSEKRAFENAAALAGISLSSWTRERLRLNAIRELEGAGIQVPFVEPIRFKEPNG
jgi:hypothetical protein